MSDKPTDRRWRPRWSVRKGALATLTTQDNSHFLGEPIDISCGGTYIGKATAKEGRASVQLEINDPNCKDKMPLERKCSILPNRTGEEGGCAVKFDTPLSAGEVALLATAGDAHGSLDLAREDYRIVNEEVVHIQGCRSNVFLATLAGMSAWTITAIGIAVTSHLFSPFWVVVGISWPYFLLTVALLATIEKAHAINLRKGFLAALSDYLRADEAPPNYVGWSHLKINRSECRSRRASTLCPDANCFCWHDVEQHASVLTSHHHVISSIFDSFMAFVSVVYGVLYIAAAVLLVAFVYYYSVLHTAEWAIIVPVDVLLGAFIAIVTIYVLARVTSLRKGKRSVESFYFQWLAIFRYCRSIQGVQISAPQTSKAITSPPMEPIGMSVSPSVIDNANHTKK